MQQLPADLTPTRIADVRALPRHGPHLSRRYPHVAPAGLLHQNDAARNPEHEAYHAIGDDGVHADEPRDLRAASGRNDSRGGGSARGKAGVPADWTHAQQEYRRGREGAPGDRIPLRWRARPDARALPP